jgi:hypothetical protein
LKIVQILKMRRVQPVEWIKILALLTLAGVYHNMRALTKDYRLKCGHEIFPRRERILL